ncbi:type II secretion system protein [Sporosarcina saromensis]|uniref:Type II secretion system protein n=1 Tax=Sporosarcina saromensis TaxID=359365 RepID=A0ABU4G5Y2_9BACL|nr:type II secretion system protein [Sporosarcina saromensis]MDW0112385.1 type II secretion system protein [Sporosarcina saromensis]
MKKWLQKRLKNEKGLTLVELLAVIVILGIIAAIAVPSIGKVIDNTKDKAILADASNILSATKLAVTQGDCKSASECEQSDLSGYLENIGGTYSTKKNESGVWTVTYSKIGDIKNDKYKATSGNTMTEDELLKKMGSKE